MREPMGPSGDERIRLPAVAGRFYPASADQLGRQVAGLLIPDAGAPRMACAVMAPHAGYVYSGAVAGRVFANIEVPPRVIVLCPNHTGAGPVVSVMTEGAYRIPGADVAVDTALADAIMSEVPEARSDHEAHRAEHAIEVELPFLVARQPRLRIVPMVLGGLPLAGALALGQGLHRAVQRVGGDVLVLASSDMSHYLPDAQARAVDRVALEPLLGFDPAGLYRTVVTRDISMCGFVPATAMLAYARAAGAAAPELVAYATSGDAFGDVSRVVGYAGVVVPVSAAAT